MPSTRSFGPHGVLAITTLEPCRPTAVYRAAVQISSETNAASSMTRRSTDLPLTCFSLAGTDRMEDPLVRLIWCRSSSTTLPASRGDFARDEVSERRSFAASSPAEMMSTLVAGRAIASCKDRTASVRLLPACRPEHTQRIRASERARSSWWGHRGSPISSSAKTATSVRAASMDCRSRLMPGPSPRRRPHGSPQPPTGAPGRARWRRCPDRAGRG
jgi:hypothetical protein